MEISRMVCDTKQPIISSKTRIYKEYRSCTPSVVFKILRKITFGLKTNWSVLKQLYKGIACQYRLYKETKYYINLICGIKVTMCLFLIKTKIDKRVGKLKTRWKDTYLLKILINYLHNKSVKFVKFLILKILLACSVTIN